MIKITCTEKKNRAAEAPILQKHFQKVPIIGLDANGEFGWNKYENSTEEGLFLDKDSFQFIIIFL